MYLHVDATGTGSTVLLAHGFGGSARNWNAQVRALRDGYHLVRYDARGHARSDAPDDPAVYTPDTFVDDLATALGPESPAVVGGLSMGAATALRFALWHPDRATGLVLASFPSDRGGFTAIAGAFADAIERDGLERAGETFVWGPSSGLDPAGARLVRQGFLEHPPHGLVHTLRGVLSRQPRVEDMADDLQTLRIPTLVVAGANDAGSLPPSRRLADLIPGAHLVVIPDAGHVVNLAAPAAFNAALLDFLRA